LWLYTPHRGTRIPYQRFCSHPQLRGWKPEATNPGEARSTGRTASLLAPEVRLVLNSICRSKNTYSLRRQQRLLDSSDFYLVLWLYTPHRGTRTASLLAPEVRLVLNSICRMRVSSVTLKNLFIPWPPRPGLSPPASKNTYSLRRQQRLLDSSDFYLVLWQD
jgi:hypothetical protein